MEGIFYIVFSVGAALLMQDSAREFFGKSILDYADLA